MSLRRGGEKSARDARRAKKARKGEESSFNFN